ncbi:MAG TPA: DNA-formamidopyrimidine glycosylase family protein, partial [Galbitalea sp.]|nr:DNA-formamidopyrimidine glycosylase family protein [Galbitalea sp.]
MPELPEVTALVADLGSRLVGREIKRLDIVSFSALKTFEISVDALEGRRVDGITRHGKFLDLTVGDVHLIMHLARAGWIRWREAAPKPSKALGRGPLTARLILDDGSGFDVTEAGTKKSLAIYLVR